MNANHLLSASLYSELFQHNLVSPDGRIIANEQQLRDYSNFLKKKSKEKVTRLYAERKNLVDDVEELLRLDSRTEEEEKLLKELVKEIDLEFDGAGSLSLKEPRKPPKRYLGPKEPEKSVFERRIEADLKADKVLKRDLKKLDDWVEQIAVLRPTKDHEEHPVDYKEAEKKYRQRTTNRMKDMENARKKLIKQHYKDYDENLKSNLSRKLPKEKYLTRIGLKKKDPKDKAEIKDSKDNGDRKVVATKKKKGAENKTVFNDHCKMGDIASEAQGSTDVEAAVKEHTEDRDMTIKEEKTVDDNVAVKDIGKTEDLTSETQITVDEDTLEDGDMETENGQDAVKDHAEDRDVTIKAEKTLDDYVAAKDIGKKEGLGSETQTSIVEDEGSEKENDKTAVKYHAEDRDVTIKAEKTVDHNVAVKNIGKTEDLATETQTSVDEENVEDGNTETENDQDIVKDLAEDRDLTIKAEKTVDDNVAAKDSGKTGDLANEMQTSIDEDNVEDGDTETENDQDAVKDHAEDRDLTIKAEKTLDDNVVVKDIDKTEDLSTETQTSVDEDNVEDVNTETENNQDAVEDHAEDRDLTIKAEKTVDDNVAAKDIGKKEDLRSETQTSIVKNEGTEKENDKTAAKDSVEDTDLTIKAEKTVDDNVSVNDIGQTEDLASETQTSIDEDNVEDGDTETENDQDLGSETQTSIVEDEGAEKENDKTAAKDHVEDKDLRIKGEKNVDHNVAVNDIGKTEDLASETQTSIVEDNGTEKENDKTASKDHVEDTDLTIKAGKTVDDNMSLKDIGKNEDLASETQTSIDEDNSEDGDTETENDKTAVKDHAEDKDAANKAQKAADDKVVVKDNSKNEDVATSKIKDKSEDRDMSTETETNVDDEINVIDNTEVKEAAAEVTDAVTDMSNKMNELKKLMVLTEDTVLKVDTSDNDVETKAQNGIDNDKSLTKTLNAVEKTMKQT